MFFRILKREITLTYMTYVLIVVMGATLSGMDAGWQPERTGLLFALNRWGEVAPAFPALALVLYLVQGWLLLTALSRLASRPVLRKDVVFYFLTTILHGVLYGLAILVPYLALKPMISHLRDTAVTEIPVLLGYLLLALTIWLLAKAVTYLKLRTRILYFCLPDPSFRVRHLFGGLGGRARTRGFFWFLLIVAAYNIPPLLLFVIAVILNSTPLLLISLSTALLSFSIGRYHLLFSTWNRVVP